MKIDKLLYGMLIAVFGFSSCYDDQGNYDYKDIDINDITILNSQMVMANYGEPVVYIPNIKYANEEVDTTIYKFEYQFDGYGIVSTERNLNYLFQGVTDSGVSGCVVVTDTTTGKKWWHEIYVFFQSVYDSGWYILSDDGGTSRLNMVRPANGEYVTDQNLYATLSGEDLGTQPYSLCLNGKGVTSMEKELRVIQHGPEGSVTLSLSDLRKLKTLDSEFASGNEPEGLHPVAMGFLDNAAAVVGEDGKMYTRIYDSNKLNYSAFANIPTQYNDRVLDIQYVLGDYYAPTSPRSLILYDKAKHCFMDYWGGSGFNASQTGSIQEVTAADNIGAGIPRPNNLEGYTNLYSSLYNNSKSSTANVFALLEKDGKYFTYTFKYSISNSSKCSSLAMNEFTAGDKVNENTIFHILRKTAYFFFATGSSLYYYDINTNEVYSYEIEGGLSGNITSMESNLNASMKPTELGIGLDNGEFYVLDITEKTVLVARQFPKPICSAKVNGKIVDICVKDGNGIQ